MPLFRRGPQLKDDALNGLSGMFLSCPTDPTPGADKLDSSKLDLSLASLAHVDDYLDAIRTRKLDERDKAVIVLRCGAYVGEVIRQTEGDFVMAECFTEDSACRIQRACRLQSILVEALAAFAIVWSILYWMYRKNEFISIWPETPDFGIGAKR